MLPQMARSMRMAKQLVSNKGKKGWKTRGTDMEHVKKNEVSPKSSIRWFLLI